MNDPFIQTENIRKFQMKGLCLTHIMSLAPLYTPLKTLATSGFLMFSGGKKRGTDAMKWFNEV